MWRNHCPAMFRIATVREMEVLLGSLGRGPLTPTALPAGADASPDQRAHEYKQCLGDVVREHMLQLSGKSLVVRLRDATDRATITRATGLQFTCRCLEDGRSCPSCQRVCMQFSEGVLTVLERDFVQLAHGQRSTLLQNRPGVRFLLTGVTLALLYEAVPIKAGLENTVLNLLTLMMAPSSWMRALELYGPAPPMPPLEPTDQGPRNRSLRANVRRHCLHRWLAFSFPCLLFWVQSTPLLARFS